MRLIDADELRAVRFHALPYTHIHALGAEPYSYELGWNDAIDAIIDNAPTVDAVEVVRCKDCTNWLISDTGWEHCYLDGRTTYENDYCSRGAKMDEVEE